MSLYYTGAALLLAALLLFIFLPLFIYRKTRINHQETISNPEIIKQRLLELESEKRESLLTEADYGDAVLETKLHLAEELPQNDNDKVTKIGWLPVGISFAAILVVTAFIYFKVNHISDVAQWKLAQEQLPGMGQRIVVQADSSVTPAELMNFALALRTKLDKEKEDAVGWLLLGRVLSTLRDYEGAILAFDNSLGIDAERPGAMFSLAQTLLLTDDDMNVLRAERLLNRLTQLSPQDNNVMGLLAIAYTRRGQEQKAIDTWRALREKLLTGDPMMATVNQQLASLEGTALETGVENPVVAESGPQITVDVSLAVEVSDKLPGNGFLFVFIQDADSEMRMPAAVKKQPLSGLDLSDGITFTLSNADAMLQEFNLSNIKNGRLIARISSDENVALQDGDLQGELIIPVEGEVRSEHQLIINKEML